MFLSWTGLENWTRVEVRAYNPQTSEQGPICTNEISTTLKIKREPTKEFEGKGMAHWLTDLYSEFFRIHEEGHLKSRAVGF